MFCLNLYSLADPVFSVYTNDHVTVYKALFVIFNLNVTKILCNLVYLNKVLKVSNNMVSINKLMLIAVLLTDLWGLYSWSKNFKFYLLGFICSDVQNFDVMP